MVLSLSEIEIAWIAGLLEGEGCFGLDNRAAKRYKVSTAPAIPYVRVAMVDKDVIARLCKLLNKNYFSPTRKTSTGKIVYIVHISDRETLRYLLPLIFPYLGNRRQQKVQECLDALTAWETWVSTGGRRDMAMQGVRAKRLKKDTGDSTKDQEKNPLSEQKNGEN